MIFTEHSRVNIPVLLQLMRLGYQYIPFKDRQRIEENNIFSSIFVCQISNINGISEEELQRLLEEINLELDYEDLGKTFNGKILNNQLQNQELASLRDWLLPMLMNGQVRVGEN